MTKETQVAKAAVPNVSVGMGELSTIGLRVSGGIVYEEANADLAWPQNRVTYNRMSYDPTIASANTTIKSFIRKTDYEVKVKSETPSPEQLDQIKLIEECMDDMDTTFNDVINEAMSFLTYGFSVHEKVFKYRDSTGKHKSKFTDGKIGWAKLPIRSQDSIWRWIYDNKGRELRYVEQNLALVASNYDPDNGGIPFKKTQIKIPRKKLLHFRHDVKRNNPEGTSPLKACYIPWQYKAKIEEYEAIGVSRDLGGLPVIQIPPEYMSEDAPDDKKAIYEYYKDVIRNLHANEQAGLILPKYVDPESKADMFTFDLKSVDGGKMYDTDKIISRYENKILMTFLADVLKLGQDASGSFALSDNKTNLLAVGIQSFVEELLQEFNQDLIPQTLAMNGWSLSDDMPTIRIKDLDERNLDDLSKYVQRCVSVGAMEVDEEFSDWLREQAGAPFANRDKKIKPEMIGGGVSDAGRGMKSGGEGNSTSASSGSGKDSSSSNKENA
jgi:hypothetical protein